MTARRARFVWQYAHPTNCQGLTDAPTRPEGGGFPGCEELRRLVRCRRVPVPVWIGGPIDRIPRRHGVSTLKPDGKLHVLDIGQVLHDSTECHRRRSHHDSVAQII